MSKTILIIDDDKDFCNLLADVFEQTSHTILAKEDPKEALKYIEENPVDLVITDEKMPDITGMDLIQRAKAKHPDLRFIVVSAYLNTEKVRKLINEGIGGVFVKPLNIFGLLKCAKTLLAKDDAAQKEKQVEETESETELPFPFKAMPCKSQASRGFAIKLHERHNFKSSLILIGAKGLPYKAISRDLEFFGREKGSLFTTFTPETVSEENLKKSFELATQKQCSELTLFLIETEKLSPEQQDLLFELHRKTGPFASGAYDARFVFCIHRDIESSYEQGIIKDSLYLMMGSSELKVPSLNECKEDIPALAEQYITAINEKHAGQSFTLTESGILALKEHTWKRNHEELEGCIEIACMEAKGASFITEDNIKGALKSAHGDLRETLKLRIKSYRDDYAGAAVILSEGEPKKGAKLLGISTDLLKQISD